MHGLLPGWKRRCDCMRYAAGAASAAHPAALAGQRPSPDCRMPGVPACASTTCTTACSCARVLHVTLRLQPEPQRGRQRQRLRGTGQPRQRVDSRRACI